MKVIIKGVDVEIILGDITEQTTNAIVNAANPSLMGGGGVDGAIHRAGGPSIKEECKNIVREQGQLPTGKAVITRGGNLKANYVIHTVGPIWHGGQHDESKLLVSAYSESLKLATEKGLRSISFPSISTGIYSYPLQQAVKIALSTVFEFLDRTSTSLTKIVFVLFDSVTYSAYEKELKQLLH